MSGGTSTRLPSTSFVSRRINASTFLIIEDDAYNEQPHIYVKIYPSHILITDTGCNSPRQTDLSLTSLITYLETYALDTNSFSPLNPDGEKKYVIICTHCHYDHILDIPQFLASDPIIVASANDKSFIEEDLPTHSLCKYMKVPTPQYQVTHWAEHLEYFSLPSNGYPFRIQFLHIPGHTPDFLAWYDIDEHYLYVGDTFYTGSHESPIPELPRGKARVKAKTDMKGMIIFPNEGADLIAYMSSLDFLLSFTQHQNSVLDRQYGSLQTMSASVAEAYSQTSPLNHIRGSPRVKIACSHLAYGLDAETTILEVRAYFEDIFKGKIRLAATLRQRGAVYNFCIRDKEARYSVFAPKRLVKEAIKHFHVEGLQMQSE